MQYIWQHDFWPNLTWNLERIAPLLDKVTRDQWQLQGLMKGLGFTERSEAHLLALIDDVVKSSEIEGEILPREQVRSSIASKLGLDIGGLVPADRGVEGVVAMMTDAAVRYHEPLTKERLCGWQAALFPTGYSGLSLINVGCYRSGPMEVISGPIGKERVHYLAPPPERIEHEMEKFLTWFEDPGTMNALLVAGLAHFWFVTIHPFDDGNGRIGRAIADMALARAEESDQRFYSLSAQMRKERNDYYKMLERAQKGGGDITQWQEWFLGCLHRAVLSADEITGRVLIKARFWQRHATQAFNARQVQMLNKLLEGFEGKLTSTKWAKIAKCSPDTALRDINNLIERGVLTKDPGGGRSTSYSLVKTNVASSHPDEATSR